MTKGLAEGWKGERLWMMPAVSNLLFKDMGWLVGSPQHLKTGQRHWVPIWRIRTGLQEKEEGGQRGGGRTERKGGGGRKGDQCFLGDRNKPSHIFL